ncbi:hypothetical protein [Bradyrhizobium sp. USDA 4486]
MRRNFGMEMRPIAGPFEHLWDGAYSDNPASAIGLRSVRFGLARDAFDAAPSAIGTSCGQARCSLFEEMKMTKTKAPDTQGAKAAPQPMLNPGDEAPPGTVGTGEDVCPDCHGKGRIDGAPCATCGGSGTVIRAVGGA